MREPFETLRLIRSALNGDPPASAREASMRTGVTVRLALAVLTHDLGQGQEPVPCRPCGGNGLFDGKTCRSCSGQGMDGGK